MGNRWLWALGLMLVLAAGAVFFWMQPQPELSENNSRILILGLDQVNSTSRSDTMIVAQLDTEGVVLLSVPRDLRVKFPDGQLRKINAAYTKGASDSTGNDQKKVNDGARLARDVVSNFLNLEIPYYVVVDFEGFQQVVDRLGGVEINIASAMDYDDEAQDLHIHFEPGTQMLNGEQALQFARFRDSTGDLKRIERQQQLIKAILAKQRQELNTFDQVQALLEMAFTHIKATNLALPELFSFAQQLQSSDFGEVNTFSLRGDNVNVAGVSYLEPEVVENTTLIDRWIKHKEFLLTSDINVVVLNGNGQQGLAGTMRDRFNREGFNVSCADNANNHDYNKTYIVTLDNDETKAELVADVLNGSGQIVYKEVVQAELDASQRQLRQCTSDAFEQADVVVIFGSDFLSQ